MLAYSAQNIQTVFVASKSDSILGWRRVEMK